MASSTISTLFNALFDRDRRSAIEKCASIADIRLLAHKNVPQVIFDFVDGGAGGEITLRKNQADFERISLLPQCLVDVSAQDTRTHYAGQRYDLPFYFGPAGLIRVVGNGGELSAVAAAGRAGVPYTISTSSSYSIEEIAAVASGPLWFQLYLWRNQQVVSNLIERAAMVGCEALVLTVDVPLNANRLRDLRNGMSIPPKVSVSTALDSLRRPRWLKDILSGEPVGFRNFMGIAEGNSALSHSEFINQELANLAASWQDLRQLREKWQKRIYIKGILTAHDAEMAIACGVDGIIVSNHGGRQLDSVPSAISALPEIVRVVNGRCDVILDGGVRSGIDVVKALCLGASAVSLARPWVFGVAAAGEAGASRVIDILTIELRQTLALLGAPAVSALGPQLARFPSGWLSQPER